MKRIDVFLLLMIGIISALLFNLLQGKLTNNYILLILFGFGVVMGLIRRFILKKDSQKAGESIEKEVDVLLVQLTGRLV